MSDSPHPFTPVPARARRDGLTPARQAAFVAALAETCCVTAAARAVGMSWQSAYRLRDRAGAASFAAAWNAALARPAHPDGVFDRALAGTARPITYAGRKIGEQRRHDDRLAMYLLRVHAPARYGRATHATSRDGDDFSRDVVPASSPSAP